MITCILKIALDTPLDRIFDYRWTSTIATSEPNQQKSESPDASVASETYPQPGQLALVPFGRQEIMGLIVGRSEHSELAADKLKDVIAIREQIPALNQDWLALCRFAAHYYQRPLGEVALPALPRNLRISKVETLERTIKKINKSTSTTIDSQSESGPSLQSNQPPALNSQQASALEQIIQSDGKQPLLLFGVTGSGKTEVYLQAAAAVLQQTPDAQILILVPEINLTPQLENNIRQRFASLRIATLHSGMAEGQRLQHWLAAHSGLARIILGTRLAILASLPHLKLIIIDEEHDPSYKQQEGLRYSARDLAVWRAHKLAIPVLLGSATPSLESWYHAKTGRYQQLNLQQRAVQNAVLPLIKIINLEHEKPKDGLSNPLIQAIKQRLAKGEQSLLFLNRRGYAPVIACDACGWISDCHRCSAHMVMHKLDHRLRCHHCGFEQKIPHACPTCGNIDLQALGRGTQRLEEGLQLLFPEARIFRIDADSTRKKGSAEAAFETVHRGEVDILIGTQMVAKGHDFKNLTLVGALNPDSALFSQDYRASERLFAQLMQVAGRAGRAAQKTDGNKSEVLVQTRYPDHPLYHALIGHDYQRFANDVLEERRQAGMPPFIFQALLRAEAKQLETAIDFLQIAAGLMHSEAITMNDPIPMAMTKVANMHRAQLLIESTSRPALQGFLKLWIAELRLLKNRVKWSVEIDPVDI